MELANEKTEYINNDFAKLIEDIANEFLGFVSSEFSQTICEECYKNIKENVFNLLDFEKPRVMVYGIYNSGKSTLINALMKREVAEMADRPVTDQISEFDHGDYFLIDSPGVDAPIQHEEITTSFINKCHIILFVISSKGGFESKQNYEKMAELISLGIPFIIVLNERGYAIIPEWSDEEKKVHRLEHEKELRDIQYKIIDNLIKITSNENIIDNYEVYVLNAKKALTGINKNKYILYKSSNIEQLESRIKKLVCDSSATDVVKQPILNLKHCLDYIEALILDEIKENSDIDYSKKIDILRKKLDNFKDDLRIFIRHETSRYIDEVARFYVDGDFDTLENVQYSVFQNVEEKYISKFNELLFYTDKAFKEVEGLHDMLEYLGVDFAPEITKKERITVKHEIKNEDFQLPEEPKKKMFQSKRSYEKERAKWMEDRATIANKRSETMVVEEKVARQEARREASHDMYNLQTQLIRIFTNDITERFNCAVDYINQAVCENEEKLSISENQLSELNQMRTEISKIEDIIF